MQNILSFLIAFFILLPCFSFAQDISELRSKAKQGDAKAMLEMVEAFEFGKGVQSNPDSAKFWLAKSADAGNDQAQYLLGIQLVRKIYQSKSFAKGVELLKKSGKQGNTDALLKLTEIYLESGRDGGSGTASAAYYSSSKALEYAKMAAEAGDKEGAFFVGEAYRKGKGATRNYTEAAKWYRTGADNGDPGCQLSLADLLFSGKTKDGIDLLAALKYYKMAHKNRRSDNEQKALGDVGIHDVDQQLKATHNLMMQSSMLLPAGAYQYQLRE